ncbi:MAG: hypothetical protein J5950_07925 [Clostridia bacterium]|nr:hypothetical protein [Clostridia bacterium]
MRAAFHKRKKTVTVIAAALAFTAAFALLFYACTKTIVPSGPDNVVPSASAVSVSTPSGGGQVPAGKYSWPSSGFGAEVPAAGFAIEIFYEYDTGVYFGFSGVSLEMAREYGRRLKDAGFTVSAAETDLPDEGLYSYSASNADGTAVAFTYMETGEGALCYMTAGESGGQGIELPDDEF